MKHDYFVWNGVRSTAYNIFVTKQPPIMIPVERVEYEEIEGRSGSIAITEGERVYEDITLPVECWARHAGDMKAFLQMIRGAGKVAFPNRPEGYYKGRLNKPAEINRWYNTDARIFTLTFRCEPYLYIHGNHDITLRTAGYVQNHFNEDALPIIRITGKGDIALSVNNRLITMNSITSGITLNSEIKEAYDGTKTMNLQVGGEYPILSPGKNAISWTGNVSSLVITPNWRMT